jgi:uncharacterized protein
MSLMSTRFIAIVITAVSAIVISLLVFNSSIYAQSMLAQNVTVSNSTLYVMGNAQTMVKPDKVILSLSVETTNKTANEALVANSKAMNNTLEALEAAGVKDNETSTSFFNISPNYNITQVDEDIEPMEPRDIISYTVTNSITVNSFNLLNLSQWIDTAVQAGVNDISSIYFSLSDEKSELVKNDLLKQAVSNAKDKAGIAASALGLNVIGVKSINIEGVEMVSPLAEQPLFSREAGVAPQAGPPTPIIAGEQQVSTRVNILFLIG